MKVEVVPAGDRVATAKRVYTVYKDVPRCAAMTRSGKQCSGTVGATGGPSGFSVVDGERVPLCSTHYDRGY